MGSGSGRSGLNSRVYTNSFAWKNNSAYKPFYEVEKGDSFYGLSKPQYAWQIYHQLAYHGAGAGGRAGRWARVNHIPNTRFGV